MLIFFVLTLSFDYQAVFFFLILLMYVYLFSLTIGLLILVFRDLMQLILEVHEILTILLYLCYRFLECKLRKLKVGHNVKFLLKSKFVQRNKIKWSLETRVSQVYVPTALSIISNWKLLFLGINYVCIYIYTLYTGTWISNDRLIIYKWEIILLFWRKSSNK